MPTNRARTKGRAGRRRRQAGLTLVEMMISLLAAAILSAGLFYMSSGQQRSYDSQVDTIALQESLWGAMEYLSRQVRRAGHGFGGCARGEIVAGKGSPTHRALRVFNSCELTRDAPASCPIGTQRSDSFSISRRDEGGGLPTQIVAAPSRLGALKIKRPEGFVAGDLLVVWPFGEPRADCYLRRVLGTAGPDARGHYNLTTVRPPGAAARAPDVDSGALVVNLGRAPAAMIPRYFAIDRSKGFPRLVTWQSASAEAPGEAFASGNFEVVADDIEDLQIAWACDADGDRTLSEGRDAAGRASDEWAFNTAADTLPDCQWRTPLAVRITLIGRARGASLRFRRGFRPAAEDRAAGTPADDRALSGNLGTYARRVVTMTVRPENLRQVVIDTP